MEKGCDFDKDAWMHLQNTSTHNTWCGLSFERFCIVHADRIKELLGISGIATKTYSVYSDKAQIDMIIERGDRVVNLFEMKFTTLPYTLEKKDANNLENKMSLLQSKLKKKQSIMNVLVSTEPIKPSIYVPEITQAKLVQACFTGECDNIPVEMASDFKQQFDAWRAETDIPLPEHLNATLRPYQIRGYSWMYKNLEIGFGCILADDMGLGKTLQVITFLLKMKQEGKFAEKKAIVVMPAGLLCNWQVEIKKFAPDLTFFAYHGGRRDLEKFNADVLLTTYATFRKDFDDLNSHEWQTIIIDEAQNIKNADSEQSKLLRRMRAPMKIAMSGTPVENRLMEFWTIMDFTNRGFFPSARASYRTEGASQTGQAARQV